jgi:amino acid adenylation domain-containing protein
MASQPQFSAAKRRLLEMFLRGEASRQSWDAPVPVRGPGESTPLAPHQQQVWLHAQMAPELPLYNEPVFIRYRGRLDRDAFVRAFGEILRRHEIWRTGFAAVDGEIVQAVHDRYSFEIPFIDLRSLAAENREEEMTRIAARDVRRPFDLSVGPLLRAKLFCLDEEDYRLHLAIHHIIMDGVTLNGILLPELVGIYEAFAQGRPSPLPEPSHQYGDYAVWHKRLLSNDSLAAQREFWKQELAGELPVLELQLGRPRPSLPSYRGSQEKFPIPAALTASVKDLSNAEGVTTFMLLLAAFHALLFRYTGQGDIISGSVTDGRSRSEFAGVMGYFLSTIALRTRPSDEMTFREFLASVKSTVLGALANADLPFDQVAREMQTKRDSSRHPVFQVAFSMRPPAMHTGSRWDLTQLDVENGTAKFDLHLSVDERPGGFEGCFLYSTDLFDAATVRRIAGHWCTLLQAALKNPDARLGDLPLLTKAEQSEFAANRNRARQAIPYQPVHQMFEAQAARRPRAFAVECDGVRLTYRELNQEANRLARRLREEGAGPDAVVAVRLHRSCDLVVALLAVLKAGASYLPIDPTFPAERQQLLLDEARPLLLLTCRTLEGPSHGRVVYCDEGSGSAQNLDALVRPDNLAYVLYTSGSTGKPKGVEIPHGALSNFLHAWQPLLKLGPGSRVQAQASLSFDFSVMEIFLALASGSRVVMLTRDEVRDPALVIERARETKCNVMMGTPATWRALIEAGWTGGPRLKLVSGGEVLSRQLADALLARCGKLWNIYGPTETTICSTMIQVTSGEEAVPIGKPLSNTDLYVLDRNRQMAPAGCPGELYIGGAGVARGYRNRPDLTKERFVTIPGGQRVYRSGDLARWTSDGTLEYLGRADDQVKIRGFRIEPGEIEAALNSHPAVRASAVKAWPDASGNLSLAAYVVSQGEHDWREFLRKTLPDYMVPSRFVRLAALPLTISGKIDRGALPEPGESAPREEFRGPSDDVERRLVRIWESLLGIRGVGVRESFFDLGGHSLLAAKLTNRIEKEFGRRLSLAMILQASTVEDLATVLRGSEDSLGPRIVQIRAAGTRPPLFWIHAGPSYRRLAHHLEKGRPFLGVTLDPAEQAALSERPELQEIAAHMARKIRETQPEGPYYLGGFCASGTVAYETAVQLQEAGQSIAAVLMLESVNYSSFFRIPALEVWKSKATYHASRLRTSRGSARWIYFAKRVRGILERPRGTKPTTSYDAKLFPAVFRYKPRPFQGRITLFQAELRPTVFDLARNWADAPVQKIEVHSVSGDLHEHESTYQGENAAGLAKVIDACLRRAEAEVNAPDGQAMNA